MWKFENFLSLSIFYVKSKLENLEVLKLLLLLFLSLWNVQVHENPNFSASNCVRVADFALIESLEFISRKIWVTEKIMRFPHCELATLKIRVAAADGQKTSSIEGSSQNLKASNLFWDFAIVSVEIFVQFFPSADRRTYWQKLAARFGHTVRKCAIFSAIQILREINLRQITSLKNLRQ